MKVGVGGACVVLAVGLAGCTSGGGGGSGGASGGAGGAGGGGGAGGSTGGAGGAGGLGGGATGGSAGTAGSGGAGCATDCSELDAGCQTGFCVDGACVTMTAGDGTPCVDACQPNGTCTGGACVDGNPISMCANGDGCCPVGCAFAIDDDCWDYGPPVQVTMTKGGSPTWKVVGFTFFRGPVGTTGSQWAEQWATMEAIAPNHEHFVAHQICGPEVAHAGPYDTELQGGVAAAGFQEGSVFRSADLQAPSGLIFAFLVVPDVGAPTGSSPDFPSGPIIEPAQFPWPSNGTLERNGLLVDSAFDGSYPALASLSPPAAGESYSHMLFFAGETSDFIDPLPGTYEYLFHVTDANGDGWHLQWAFEVQ